MKVIKSEPFSRFLLLATLSAVFASIRSCFLSRSFSIENRFSLVSQQQNNNFCSTFYIITQATLQPPPEILPSSLRDVFSHSLHISKSSISSIIYVSREQCLKIQSETRCKEALRASLKISNKIY